MIKCAQEKISRFTRNDIVAMVLGKRSTTTKAISRRRPAIRKGSAWLWYLLLLFLLTPLSGPAPLFASDVEAFKLNQEAVALANKGQLEEAARLLERAFRLSPRNQAIRKNLAGVHVVMGHRHLKASRFVQAREMYETALGIIPNDEGALLGMGQAHMMMRDPKTAAQYFGQVLGAHPENFAALVGMGEAYYQQGNLKGALSEWKHALDLQPNDGALRERIKAVEQEAGIQRRYEARETRHFALSFEGRPMEDMGRALLDILEEAYSDVGYALREYPANPVPTILYSDRDFVAVTGTSTEIGGFYGRMDGKIRVALRGLRAGDQELRSTLYHEYTHALVYSVTRGNNPPRWVHEGLAVYMEKERGPRFKQSAVQMAAKGNVPSLDSSPYVHGFVAIEYLIERRGMGLIQNVLRKMGKGMAFHQAFREAAGMDLPAFEKLIRDYLTGGG